MKLSRKAKRRTAAITSAKIVITSVSLAATLGGWAVISASDARTVQVSQVQAAPTELSRPSVGATTQPRVTATPSAPSLTIIPTRRPRPTARTRSSR